MCVSDMPCCSHRWQGAQPDQLLTLARITTTGYRGDTEKVEELIKLKADLHATDALGNSPLHLAAFNGHAKVIRWEDETICPFDTFFPNISALLQCSVLLDAGADPSHQNGELDTPLYMAVLSNNLQCVKLISEKVCKILFAGEEHVSSLDCV